jgi:hypothetical protein
MFHRKLFVLEFWAINALILAPIVRDEISGLDDEVRNDAMELAPFVMKLGAEAPDALFACAQLPEILRGNRDLIGEELNHDSASCHTVDSAGIRNGRYISSQTRGFVIDCEYKRSAVIDGLGGLWNLKSESDLETYFYRI